MDTLLALGRLPTIHSLVSQCTCRPQDISGRVIATWNRDASRHAIVDTVLEAGQTTARKLSPAANTLTRILLAKIR